MAFVKKKIYTSPIGIACPFPYIDKADDKYDDRGKYKVDLILPNDERTQKMIDVIVAEYERDYAARLEAHKENPPKVQPGKKPLKPYQGDLPFFDNGDGTTTFKFNSYGSYKDKKTGEIKQLTLPVVDSQGKRYPSAPKVFGGSELKIKFSLVPYGWTAATGASVKLQLEGVMVVKLATFGGNDADEWADDVVEGGETVGDTKQSSSTPDEYEQYDEEGEEEPEDDGDF